jgi:excisionase family DNA binding protein
MKDKHSSWLFHFKQQEVTTMNEQNELITISELSQRLKVPVSWIYSRSREKGEGTIPLMRVGKHLRFNYEDVRQWLQGIKNV